MARRKYTKFALLKSNGEWETFKVPCFFNAADVARSRRYDAVVMHVPKGHNVPASQGLIKGPAWAVYNREAGEFVHTIPGPDKISQRKVYDLAF